MIKDNSNNNQTDDNQTTSIHWGWIIFWLFVFWPAIIFILIFNFSVSRELSWVQKQNKGENNE